MRIKGSFFAMPMTAIGLLTTQTAIAQISCPAPNSSKSSTVTCTIAQNQGGDGRQVVIDFTGSSSHDDGYGGNYTVINNGAQLHPTSPSLAVKLKGFYGYSSLGDTMDGGQGGKVIIRNSGELSVSSSSSSSSYSEGGKGAWDDGGVYFSILGASVGGNGGSATSSGDGGPGGNGSEVVIDNTGKASMQNVAGGAVIYGGTIGGNGGNQNDGPFGNQKGGDGGDSNTVEITNSGQVSFSSSVTQHYAWGIAAESLGGDGGTDNGEGGGGGEANSLNATMITNRGSVSVVAEGGAPDRGVRGLYATSQGGNGKFSNDGDDNGGAGGTFDAARVVNSGSVFVQSANLPAPSTLEALSGGIVALGQGGDGGKGPSIFSNFTDVRGGHGGTARDSVTVALEDGASVSTRGDYLPGVSVLSRGGQGGPGVGDSHGGDGGAGGSVEVTLLGDADIDTEGSESHGIIARSYGGAGGGVSVASGFVDFTTVEAGNGGSGGTVHVKTGDAAQGLPGGSIRTSGTYAIGIVGQSMGGIGGSTTDSFHLIGNAGSDAGKGGASGKVTIDNGSDITTHGSFSHGIVAQTVGGGGGIAGESSGIIALGGEGGTGINGGTTVISNAGDVTTLGTSSMGILAQSIGGGGGDGGYSNGVILIGGSGGGGGDGGSSTINANGRAIQTAGDHGYGLVSQSIGGGGGTGGASYGYGGSPGFSMALAVGGAGGDGGKGGEATVNMSNASIQTGMGETTEGDAHGVVVQSIGGGGGAGGSSAATAVSATVPVIDAASFGVTIGFSMGGTGGDGGSGSTARANVSNSAVTTNAENSHGVLVQSIGGGGGIGGSASANAVAVGIKGGVGGTVSVSLGGSGGGGNHGGEASLALDDGSILTRGDSSNAVMLQSIGGGGGAGGAGSAKGSAMNMIGASLSIGLGGSGDSGGNGGTVNFSMSKGSAVTTEGDGARAVLLQSIGGGGGASQGGQVGLTLSGSSGPYSAKLDSQVGVGRGGAAGGHGGLVNINSDGTIITYGSDADGLLVQSIGGSGGLGGSVGGKDGRSIPRQLWSNRGLSALFDVYIGGQGGAGGYGGDIGSGSAPASLGASIQTFGDYADAAVLQSIGGGGGAGGSSTVPGSVAKVYAGMSVGGRGGSGGRGGMITVFLNGNDEGNSFTTEGYGAMGIAMQSIGGGGGMAGSGSPQARGHQTLGGTGGAWQDGGSVTVADRSWADILTKGDSAYGMVLQSIGGGGGVAMAGSTETATTADSQEFDMAAGNVNGGGSGGSIKVSTGLRLNTHGDRAAGVIAQSIADGGGIATSGAASDLDTIALGSQRAAGNYSLGGDVSLKLTGSLTTRGAGAHGIIAQSIGGGGGIVGDMAQPVQFDPEGFAVPSPRSFAGSSGGTGGHISVAFDGNVATSGANAHGIVAQSIGGGGGLAGGPQGGFAGSVGPGGLGRTVTVVQSGSLQATGEGSAGIFAQSDAGNGTAYTDSATVTIDGSVQGGSGSGSGVWIASGRNNQLTVNAGGSLSALSGVAVRYDGKDAASGAMLRVDNYGRFQGSAVCGNSDGSQACDVQNHKGGVLSGALVYNAKIDNDGLIVIGNAGGFEPLVVSGDLRQSESGTLRSDVDFRNMASSQMIVQGDADLAGRLDVMPHALLPNRELAVLTVQGERRGALEAVDSPVFDYEVRQEGRQALVRVASVDFDAASMELDEHQKRIASHLQSAWDKEGAALAPLFGQLDQASRQGADVYRERVTDLSPGVAAAPAVQSAANLAQFTHAMMSCPGFTGVDAMTGERNCFWGQVSSRWTSQDGHRGAAAFDYDTVTYQFGGQHEIRPGWFLGGSAAYESSRLNSSDSRNRGDGDSGYVGVVLKRQEGPWVFSAAVGGGYGSYDMKRRMGIAGHQSVFDSSPDVYGFNARLRAARTFVYDNFYVKPYVDLDAGYTRMPGYEESGSNPLALSVEGGDQFIVGLSPMIEVGGRAQLENGMVLRPYMYAGVSLSSRDEWSSRARLRGAPADVAAFNTVLPFDDVVGKVGVGLDVMRHSGMDLRLQYDGRFSSRMRSHSATLKLVVPF